MDINQIINNIKKEFTSDKKISKLSLLEDLKIHLIEFVRSLESKKIRELVNFTKENNNKQYDINLNGINSSFSINFFKDEKIDEKNLSKFNTLEVAIEGRKQFKIFDHNNSKFAMYKLIPFYGIVYSKNTAISSKVFSKSTLIYINIEDD